MKPASFSYHSPKSVSEAVALLAELAPQDGRVLAGGQSLVPTMAFRMARSAHLIDINGIAELAALKTENEVLMIGACVRHAAFDSETVLGATGTLLRKVVKSIAHHAIRTRGTFCGSVANADPASEWCCVMAALDGTAVLQSQRGTRHVQASEFYQELMTTALDEDELLIRYELPMLAVNTRSGFVEFSRRRGGFAIARPRRCLRAHSLKNPSSSGRRLQPRRLAIPWRIPTKCKLSAKAGENTGRTRARKCSI